MTFEQVNDHRQPEVGTAQVAHSALAQEAFSKGSSSPDSRPPMSSGAESNQPPATVDHSYKFAGGIFEKVTADPKTGHPDIITFSQLGHSAELINYYDKNLHMKQQTLRSDIHDGKRDTTTTTFDASGKAKTISHAALENNQLKSTDTTDVAIGVTVHDDFQTGRLFKGCTPTHFHETVSRGKKVDSPSVGKDGKKLPDTFDATVATLKKGFH